MRIQFSKATCYRLLFFYSQPLGRREWLKGRAVGFILLSSMCSIKVPGSGFHIGRTSVVDFCISLISNITNELHAFVQEGRYLGNDC